jgi:hypothetical protein
MARPISPPVRFRKHSAKSLVRQVDGGGEPPYPVYRFGRTAKFERPEVAGQTYRRYRDLEE